MTQSKTTHTLFRRQSLAFQQQRLQGDVLIRVSPPLVLCWSLLLVWICLLAIWLASQKYTRKVTVNGWLEPVTGIAKQFAGHHRGMIESLHVTEGQHVTAGQVIASIRPFSGTGYNTELTTTLLTEVEHQLQSFEQQISAAQQQYELQLEALERQKSNYLKAQQHIQYQRTNLVNQLAILNNRIDRFSAALLLGHMADNDFEYLLEQQLQLEFQQQTLAKEYNDYENLIDLTDGQITELPLQHQSQVAGLNQRHSALRQRLAELTSLQHYSAVASADGVVTNLQVHSGQSIEPHQAILSIIPTDTQLQAHLLVPVSSAGLLKIGSNIRLKYDAYQFQKFGLHEVQLSSLSQSTISPADLIDSPITVHKALYLAYATLYSSTMPTGSEEIALRPGMTFSADIELEQRSLWEWLIEPVLSLKGESL